MKRILVLFVFAAGLFWNALSLVAQVNVTQELQALRSSGSPAAEKLHKLFHVYWEWVLAEAPEMASQLGRLEYNDRWSDRSLAAIERRTARSKEILELLQNISRSDLTGPDQLNYDIFLRQISLDVEGAAYPEEFMPITQLGGIHQAIPQLVVVMPNTSLKHYEDILARLNGVPEVVKQTIELLRLGLAKGVTPPAITLRDVPNQVKSQMISSPWESPILKPFLQFPASFSEKEKSELKTRAEVAYKTRILPAYAELHTFLKDEYVPKARREIAAKTLPQGTAWYAYSARVFTTTDLSPQQIHEIGQSEVKRIRAEMEKIIKETGFKGNFQQFCKFLRTDSRFFYKTPEELLAGYRDISKRADPELTKLFGRLPRTPYGVIAVPGYSEKSQTTAYYQPGSMKAGRPGYFFANTYDLKSRPKWEMEALTLHEAVPGHHLQIAIAQELEGLPEFRKHGRFTAFVEGWGLYSESLGTEMGFYQDPYSRFGQLTYEMWRAVRLVVDTGMHALGWSREQAIEFFKANSSKPEHDIIVEIDRYIVWPGQALAYKIGELKIKELRALGEKELGKKFDIRQFHDELLGSGAVPLDVLEARMKAWIKRLQ